MHGNKPPVAGAVLAAPNSINTGESDLIRPGKKMPSCEFSCCVNNKLDRRAPG
jgi:hypothetical protein